MKLIKKQLEKDRSGSIVLCAEEDDDMWHVYNLLCEGDQLRASTIRRIQTESSTGSTASHRMRLTLTIRVTSVDFDVQAAAIHVNGQVCVENDNVRLNAFHTVDLEPHRPFTIYKPEWDRIWLDRVHQACDVSERAEIAAVIMHEGLANVCLLTRSMTVVKQRIEATIPKKRKGSTAQYDKSMVRFFDQITQAVQRCVRFDVIKVLIIASPGFVKEAFYEHFWSHVTKSSTDLLQHKPKCLLIHSSTGHKHALQEVLIDPSVQKRVEETQYAKESKALGDFFTCLSENPDKAFYGPAHVYKAAEIGAIQVLLLTDALFRSADIPTRRKYIALVDDVRKSGAQVYIFSSLHVTGEQLGQFTGVAAILKYPAPQIEEEVELEMQQAKAK